MWWCGRRTGAPTGRSCACCWSTSHGPLCLWIKFEYYPKPYKVLTVLVQSPWQPGFLALRIPQVHGKYRNTCHWMIPPLNRFCQRKIWKLKITIPVKAVIPVGIHTLASKSWVVVGSCLPPQSSLEQYRYYCLCLQKALTCSCVNWNPSGLTTTWKNQSRLSIILSSCNTVCRVQRAVAGLIHSRACIPENQDIVWINLLN